MNEKVVRIVDLKKLNKTLVTGTPAGKVVAEEHGIPKVVQLELKASEKMLVTTSFFLGLLSKVDLKESQIHFHGFSTQTQCEFKKALKKL